MFKCIECGTEFNDQSAYCEDYRDPSKKLGCPGCKTFYVKANEKVGVKNFLLTLALIFSAMGLGDSIYHSHIKAAFQFGVISILLAIYIYKYVPVQKWDKIEKV